jgi:WD40 repeat protein
MQQSSGEQEMSVTARLLQDTVRVLQEYKVPLSSHALHTYHSAFVTMPQCLLLDTLQQGSLPKGLPSMASARSSRWGSWNRVMQGHKSQVRCVAVSPNSQRIVSGSEDRTVRVWDAVTLEQLARLDQCQDYVSSIAFSFNGTRFVACSVAGLIYVWDSLTLQQLVELELNRELISLHTWLSIDPRAFCAIFSNDGTRLVAAAAGEVCVWSAITFEELGGFKAHAPLALSPDDTRILAFRLPKMTEAAVYDAVTFQELVRLEMFATDVRAVAFSPEGHHIVFGLSDNTVRIWSTVTWTEIASLKSPAYIGGVSSIAFSPCGARIVSASSDRTLRLWDIVSHKQLASFKGHESSVSAVASFPDGTQFVSGSEDNTVRIWSAVDFEDSLNPEDDGALRKWALDTAFLPEGGRIMTLSVNEPLRICDADTLDELGKLQHVSRAGDVDSVIVWSPDGSLITTRYGPHNSLRVWSTTTFAMAAEIRIGLDDAASFECAVFSPDNTRIVSGMRNGAVFVWSTISSEVLAELSLDEPGSRVQCVAYSPCGSHIAAGSGLTLKVWSSTTYEQLYVYQSPKFTTSLEFSCNGALLMAFFSTKDRKKSVCIVWSIDTFQLLTQFESDFYRRSAFTADGKGILFDEEDGTTSAWMQSQADHTTCEFPNVAPLLSLTPFRQLRGNRFRSRQ